MDESITPPVSATAIRIFTGSIPNSLPRDGRKMAGLDPDVTLQSGAIAQ